jgi:hypothetical protein
MQFHVPQFIEVEDKIFGPFTLKQFIYMAGGAGMAFVVYKVLDVFLPLIITLFFVIPIIALAGAFAFYKINDKPFIYSVEAALRYYLGEKLYTWKKENRPMEVIKKAEKGKDGISSVPTLSESKLKDLSWGLDVLNTNKEE